MKISKVYSIKPLTAVPKWLPISFVFFSVLGFLDAAYLTAEHYFRLPLPCSILQGCEKVTTSPYSMFAGLPVALFGAVYYLVVIVLTVLYFDTGKTRLLSFLGRFVFLGLAASLYFLYIQLFVINAVCIYCLGSILTSTALFVLGLWALRHEG